MNKPINWEEWEKDMESKLTQENLKKTKSGSIAFIKEKDHWIFWDAYHAHWETYLTTDYWQNWQEKINSFKSKKEVHFYTSKLRSFIEFVKDNSRKDISYVEGAKPRDPIDTPKLIEKELKRLENIGEEEFSKTDKWGKSTEWRELSAKEALNDPWFSNEIDKIFGLNGKSGGEVNVVYTNGKKYV
jgi:hypothetical protein